MYKMNYLSYFLLVVSRRWFHFLNHEKSIFHQVTLQSFDVVPAVDEEGIFHKDNEIREQR